ncbi:MAG: type II toxin-antitoxin system RelE/ParE family toxin [Methylophagaceae bacterium]
MAGYLFYPTADQRQDEIWDYTVGQWDEIQAEKYITELHQHLNNLASNRLLWHTLPNKLIIPQDLSLSVYFSRYGNHIIFFRELSSGMIGIMTILHETMDLPVRLSEDLRKIND